MIKNILQQAKEWVEPSRRWKVMLTKPSLSQWSESFGWSDGRRRRSFRIWKFECFHWKWWAVLLLLSPYEYGITVAKPSHHHFQLTLSVPMKLPLHSFPTLQSEKTTSSKMKMKNWRRLHATWLSGKMDSLSKMEIYSSMKRIKNYSLRFNLGMPHFSLLIFWTSELMECRIAGVQSRTTLITQSTTWSTCRIENCETFEREMDSTTRTSFRSLLRLW